MIKAKQLNEKAGFYNPFDDDVKSEPIALKDTGNYLDKAKEDFNINKLKWSRSGDSFKVKANSKFRKGEIVEICPVIIVDSTAKNVEKIKDILFEIDKNKDQYGLVLGYGALYTHSETPNLDFAYKASTKHMYFIARRNIKENEELNIDYGIEYFKEKTDLHDINQKLEAAGLDPIEDEVDESGFHLDNPGADIDPNNNTKTAFSQPNDRNNPVISGRAILGLGQQ